MFLCVGYVQCVNAGACGGQKLWIPWSWSYMQLWVPWYWCWKPYSGPLKKLCVCSLNPGTLANVRHLQITPYSSTIPAVESWPKHSLEPHTGSFPAQASTAELPCSSPICPPSQSETVPQDETPVAADVGFMLGLKAVMMRASAWWYLMVTFQENGDRERSQGAFTDGVTLCSRTWVPAC